MQKIFVFLIFTVNLFGQGNIRYRDSLFTALQTHTNRVYATAPELNSPYTGESAYHNVDLKMHVFQPQGDTLSLRPILICAHGGAFVSGNKEHEDMMAFCEEFAERGYVTATIQYRLGMNLSSQISGERSVYRAIQDSRALIRYIKEYASELKVDTSNVFYLGSSAGAFTALHNLYMDKAGERPQSTYQVSNVPPTFDDGPDLGGFDAINGSCHHGSHPKAIISLWGAVQDTILIEPDDHVHGVFLVHGTNDQIVPFDAGSPFNAPNLSPTYGSNPIHQRLTHLSIDHDTYFVNGEGHEFYGVLNGNWNPAPNAYWDSVLAKTVDFLYRQHQPEADFSFVTDNNRVIFTDLSLDAARWEWNFDDGNTSQQQNPVHVFADTGFYQVTLTVFNQIETRDSITKEVMVMTTDVGELPEEKNPEYFLLHPNFPNPFNPQTTIVFSLTVNDVVSLRIYNLLGQEIATLVDQTMEAGTHRIKWNGKDMKGQSVPGGIYIVRMKAGDYEASIKIIMAK